MTKPPEWSPIDRALRDLGTRLEGRTEDERVQLTVRDVRALLVKVYETQHAAETADQHADDAKVWSWFMR